MSTGKFKPGNNANPKGSDGGKGKLDKQLKDLLIHCVSDAVSMVERCLRAEDFDERKWAADTVFNRIFGRPKESVEHSGQLSLPPFPVVAEKK